MSLKVITWNVNSITVRLERLLALLDREKPDVVCLQELKCITEKFPREAIEAKGYHALIHGQKTYNGVAILSRKKLTEIGRSFEDNVEDTQARFIFAELESGQRVASVYVPNGAAVGTDKYDYKLKWYSRFSNYLKKHDSEKEELIVAGDFNVAPEDRDVHDPEAWRGQILFSDPEKSALKKLTTFGLADTFRKHHEEDGFYSWWDYRNLAFPKNKGLRIDFILATPPLLKRCKEASILREERKGPSPSDHAPVRATFN